MANETLPPSSYPQLPVEPRPSWLAQNRQSVILGSIALVLAAAAGITTLVHRSTSPRTSGTTNTVTTNTSTPGVATTNRPTFRRYQAQVMADRDSDGLSDQEEKQAGTNPNVVDTDGDGLSDYEEVKIYQTNPLKKDSDGDGQTDGAEVKAGTNPNGPGTLRDLPQAIQQLNNTNQ